ncbi:DUF5309 family protein [Glycomyces sp. NPDC048151]|uniref:SU10 major capsid protein n=1 Tax=Glycomyces sp. NPDC048151 TaxID=3364002 RepID=UPI0037105EEB
MAGITGQGTTFNLPNYVGELFAITPTDTPFLSAIGGLTGGESVNHTLFQWQGYDLRDASATRQRLEGANAPTAEERTRSNVVNVVEIHQEAVEVSYTKMGATGQYNSTGSSHAGAVGIAGSNPIADELGWQITQALTQVALDINKSFITGTFNNPSTNATARRTKGIMEATSTNVSTQGGAAVGTATIESDTEVWTITGHGLAVGDEIVITTPTGGADGVLVENQLYYVATVPDPNTFTVSARAGGSAIAFATDGGAVVYEPTPLTEALVLDLMQLAWENGGLSGGLGTVLCNATMKRALTKLFITDKNYQEQTRNIGGVAVQTIETDFGRLNLMLERHMPTAALQIVSLGECAPVFFPIPDKGFLFVEELSKVGASEKRQMYGEVGLKFGNERRHAKMLRVGAAA